MSGLGQSVRSAEAKPAAAYGSRRRALLALLPTDAQILSQIAPQPASKVAPKDPVLPVAAGARPAPP